MKVKRDDGEIHEKKKELYEFNSYVLIYPYTLRH